MDAIAQVFKAISGARGDFLGTAFAVSGEVGLTAFHCIGDRKSGEVLVHRMVLLFQEDITIEAEPAGGDPRADFALLHFLRPLPDVLQPIPVTLDVLPYASFRCAGYPPVSGPDVIYIHGTVVAPDTRIFGGVDALQLYSHESAAELSLHGMSGSPVLVGIPEAAVGLIRWSPESDRDPGIAAGGMVYACPIRSVLNFRPELRQYVVGAPLFEEWKGRYCAYLEGTFAPFPVRELVEEGTTVDIAAEARILAKAGTTPKEAEPSLKQGAMATLADARGHKNSQTQYVADALAKRKQSGKPGHFVLLGEPGDGKTTLLHKLLLSYARNGQFPLFVRSFEWEKIDTLETWIESGHYLQGKNTPEAFGPRLLQYVREGKAPVLVDGLDEVDAPYKVVAKIQDFAAGEAGKNAVILVTCRTAVYRNALSSFEQRELCALERREVEQYVKARLKQRADKFLADIESDPATRALAGNGLMLAMMTHLYARGGVQLPTSKDELYYQIVKLFLDNPEAQRRPVRHPKVYPLALKRAALEEIAFHSYFCPRRQQEMLERYVLTALGRLTAEKTWQDYRGREDDLLKDILLNSGLLFQRALGDPIRFFHPTLQEYFAAGFVVARWSCDDLEWRDWLPNCEHWQWDEAETFACPTRNCEGLIPTFAVMATKPEYREFLLLLVGMLEDGATAKVFLRGLADELPFLYGLCEPNHAPQRYKVWFTKIDDERQAEPFPDKVEWPSPLDCEPALSGYVETMVLCDRIQTHLQFALHALSRCVHAYPDLLRNDLRGLESVSWRQFKSNDDDLVVLEQARTEALRGEAVRYYAEQLEEQTAPVGVRASAAWKLGCIGDARAGDTLTRALTNPQVEAWVRKNAGWALGQIGDSRAAEALSKIVHTKDEDANVLRSAVSALAEIGSDGAIEALVNIMKDLETEDEVRSDVAEALVRVSIRNAHAADTLFNMMSDPSADKIIRRSSANALAKIGDHRAREVLIQALKDLNDEEDRRDAMQLAFALCESGDDRAIEALCQILRDRQREEGLRADVAMRLQYLPDERVIRALCEVVTDSQVEASVRIYAGWALSGALGRLDDAGAMDALLQVLTNPRTEAGVRHNAANVLAQFGGDRAKEPLYRVVTDRQVEEEVRRSAARALGIIGDRRAASLLLLEMLDLQAEPQLRYIAAAALGNIADPRATDVLLQALTDPHAKAGLPGWFPSYAVWALGRIGDDHAVEALSQVMTTPQLEDGTRASAASALGATHNPRAVDALLPVLIDRQIDPQIRINAAEALDEGGGDRAVDALIQALTDLNADYNVRHSSAVVLGRIGGNRATDALKAFAENERVTEWERRAAVETLLEQCEPRWVALSKAG